MSTNNPTNSRLLSLDALRGFDMIWLLGAEGVFVALYIATGWQFWNLFAEQFQHSEWHGFTFYDLIFPLFIFLSGVALGIKDIKVDNLKKTERIVLYRKACFRLVALCFLGIVYNHGWGQGIPMELTDIRYASVLMRIGTSWFICAMIVWHFNTRDQLLIAIIILVGYWILLMFVATPEGNVATLTITGSWNSWVDRHWLPGATYQGLATDPEGLLSLMPAVVNALAGAYAGRLLVSKNSLRNRKLRILLFASLSCLLLGYLWSFIFPFNKVLWTSSFCLFSIGCSGLLLYLFYYLFDVFSFPRVAYFFSVIGANAILLYMATSLFDWTYTANSLSGGLNLMFGENWKPFISLLSLVLFQWLLASQLYKRKIFLRL